MARISQQLEKALQTGEAPPPLEQLVDFQLYLASKRIMQLKKEDRASYLKKIPSCFHDRIREHALVTIRYFTASKNGANINTSTNNGETRK